MALIREARSGRATEEVIAVAKEEGVPAERIVRAVAEGRVVIPRSAKGREVRPVGIGEGLRIKVNANVGTSAELCDQELEVRKAEVAVRYGADTVMDLSTAGDLDAIRRAILRSVDVPVGTVPIYQAAVEAIKRRGVGRRHDRGRYLQRDRAPRQGRRGLHDHTRRDN